MMPGTFMKNKFDILNNYYQNSCMGKDGSKLDVLEKMVYETIVSIEEYSDTIADYKYNDSNESIDSVNNTHFEFTDYLYRIKNMFVDKYFPQYKNRMYSLVYKSHLDIMHNPNIKWRVVVKKTTLPCYTQSANEIECNILMWWIYNNVPYDIIEQLVKKEPLLIAHLYHSEFTNSCSSNIFDFIRGISHDHISDTFREKNTRLFLEYFY